MKETEKKEREKILERVDDAAVYNMRPEEKSDEGRERTIALSFVSFFVP